MIGARDELAPRPGFYRELFGFQLRATVGDIDFGILIVAHLINPLYFGTLRLRKDRRDSTRGSFTEVWLTHFWWHSYADLGQTVETFTDISKPRRGGFPDDQETSSSFPDLFDRLRAERIIPPAGRTSGSPGNVDAYSVSR